nr:hypothetical protein [Tanacetum cinerariifolium]
MMNLRLRDSGMDLSSEIQLIVVRKKETKAFTFYRMETRKPVNDTSHLTLSIIETLKFSDQHKKLLDSVLLDKLKLEREVELEEEAATEEVIRSFDKVQSNKSWLMSMFGATNHEGYANVAWLIAKWLKRKGVGTQKESMICCGQFVTRLAKRLGDVSLCVGSLETFEPGLHKVMHRPKPSKTIKRHNGPKLSPDQTGYGPEASRRTKGFQRMLPQHSGSPLGKPKSASHDYKRILA